MNNTVGKKQKEYGPFSTRKIAVRMAKEVLGDASKRDKDFYVGTHGGEWWYWSKSPVENTLPEAERKKLEAKAEVIAINPYVKYDTLPEVFKRLGLHVYPGSEGMVVATAPMTKSAQKKLVTAFKETHEVEAPKKKKRKANGEAEAKVDKVIALSALGSNLISALLNLGLRVYTTKGGYVVATRELTAAEIRKAKVVLDLKDLGKAVQDVLNMSAKPDGIYHDATGAMRNLRQIANAIF